ncbi:hypothetical protein ACH5RR_030955 [Cinchona calisaya]|uniref:YTH domain-containing family protein n=1 Tax=Cinchona calisaya TaxID=153742 RepID=A0ABD2YDT7_9GENT
MEVYNFPEQGYADNSMIQGIESNSQFTNQGLERFEAMYNEPAQEFAIDQGLYYPTATNYGYICTGFDSPGEWDDHHRDFGLDGQDIQYAGAQNESFPFLYYTPNYGYGQSPYNPYNPYIPGAILGVDGSYLGAQQYYTIPSYENPSSSPAFFPVVVQSRSDLIANNTTDPFIHTSTSTANRADGPGLKQNISTASSAFTSTLLRPASPHINSLTRGSHGTQTSAGSSKRPVTHGNVTSSTSSRPASNQILRGGGTEMLDYVPRGKAFPSPRRSKVAFPHGNGSSFGSTMHAQPTAEKLHSKFLCERDLSDTKGGPDALTEQNRGPRVDKPKNQLTVKAYTTRAGDADAQGNIIIYADQYNKDDFQVDYISAKFFVIKSYSEDDVHKSVKYNVWSSTPNGNKKLNSAYEDAQRIANGDSGGCPVFLFFSVNASGQFCGVAEMTGPVDFHKDMDFWQQDKWSGGFPVKWHIIKDVPNPSFRHIILENNDNKPVTNSRDTQEVRYRNGIEMLKVFKNYISKTSLLDDFMYYENRQKSLQEEKARLVIKNYERPFRVPVIDPPRKLTSIIDLSSKEDDKISKHKDLNNSDDVVAASLDTISLDGNTKNSSAANENVLDVADGEASTDDVLNIGTLAITSKLSGSETLEVFAAPVANSAPTDIVTVGSMPVKVNGVAESPGFLTFGTIPPDPRAFLQDKVGYRGKGGLK